jgi:hypothetical protein
LLNLTARPSSDIDGPIDNTSDVVGKAHSAGIAKLFTFDSCVLSDKNIVFITMHIAMHGSLHRQWLLLPSVGTMECSGWLKACLLRALLCALQVGRTLTTTKPIYQVRIQVDDHGIIGSD